MVPDAGPALWDSEPLVVDGFAYPSYLVAPAQHATPRELLHDATVGRRRNEWFDDVRLRICSLATAKSEANVIQVCAGNCRRV